MSNLLTSKQDTLWKIMKTHLESTGSNNIRTAECVKLLYSKEKIGAGDIARMVVMLNSMKKKGYVTRLTASVSATERRFTDQWTPLDKM